MKRILLLVFSVLLIVGLVGTSHATLVEIDFGDGTHWAEVGGFYESLEVTFENARWAYHAPSATWASMAIVSTAATVDTYSWGKADAIVGTFTTPVNFFSIDSKDAEARGAAVEVYDISGALILREEFAGGPGGNLHPFVFENLGTSIKSFQAYQLKTSGTLDGVSFDNLVYEAEPVPEPATILLLGSGLIGLAGFRRKFSKKG